MEELKSLVLRAQAGELEAYGEIVRRFQDMAYGYAYSLLGDFHLAEDAAQEAFIEAYRCLAKLREPAAFPGWFRRIVFKHCDRITRQRLLEEGAAGEVAVAPSPEPSPPEVAERREMRDTVLQAVRALPEDQRTVTTLFYINGYSQKEIADFLEVPVTRVNNRLHASRMRLKERMTTMVRDTLKQHALPEDFAQRLVLSPFPTTEPPVEIKDLPGDTLKVRVTDDKGGFLPLEEHGACNFAGYLWPAGRLTYLYERRVIASSKRGGRTVLRIWERSTQCKKQDAEPPSWSERYILIEKGHWRGIELNRAKPGQLRLTEERCPGMPQDPPWEPVPMFLSVGLKWGGFGGAEVVGVSRVRIGRRFWRCLRTVSSTQHYKTADGSPALYAECYVAETGRTVLARRYNAPDSAKPGWPWSFDSLAGSPEVEFKGKVFRLYYDWIPDIALEKWPDR